VIFWVGITDTDWFEHLAREQPLEVNFWQPSGRVPFRALSPGGLFLFKLHSPQNFVVGGGWFVRYSALPASVAWKAFETKNGVRSFSDLVSRVRHYARDDSSPDPIIGCIVLEQPFFWPRDQWIDVSTRWSPNIVRGRIYDTAKADGADLWHSVRAQLVAMPEESLPTRNLPTQMDEDAPRWTQEFLTRARLGQGAFRILVTEAYRRRCAITGERTLPVLDAAHIRPYAELGPHRLANGLLLRSDVHTLFDLGYVTVTPDFKVEVSKRIRELYENGRDYYALHGKGLSNLPDRPEDRPSADYLRWHNESRFRS
jgi:putative restriction endonuclease